MLDTNKFDMAVKEFKDLKKECKRKLLKAKEKVQESCNHPELSKFVAEPFERTDVNYPVSYTCLKCGKDFGFFDEQSKLEPRVDKIVNILGFTLRDIKNKKV